MMCNFVVVGMYKNGFMNLQPLVKVLYITEKQHLPDKLLFRLLTFSCQIPIHDILYLYCTK